MIRFTPTSWNPQQTKIRGRWKLSGSTGFHLYIENRSKLLFILRAGRTVDVDRSSETIGGGKHAHHGRRHVDGGIPPRLCFDTLHPTLFGVVFEKRLRVVCQVIRENVRAVPISIHWTQYVKQDIFLVDDWMIGVVFSVEMQCCRYHHSDDCRKCDISDEKQR